jgi:hypothetical protein
MQLIQIALAPMRAAAKPSQVMKPNSNTNTIRAVQFTSCTAGLPYYLSIGQSG